MLNFYFDRIGKPSFAGNQVITVGTRSMTIEAETVAETDQRARYIALEKDVPTDY